MSIFILRVDINYKDDVLWIHRKIFYKFGGNNYESSFGNNKK